jgi:MFS family permease
MLKTFDEMRSALRGNLGVIVVSTSLWSLGRNLTMPFFALYVLELGGSYVDVGKIFAVGAVIKVVPILLGGYLADRVGRKRIVYSMSYLLASVALINAFAPDYRFLLVAAVLEALFVGFREPSFSSIIGDSTDPENRATGYALLMISPILFGVFSPSIIGVLMDRYGVELAMRWGFVVWFATGLFAAFLRHRYLTETLTVDVETAPRRNSLGELVADYRATLTNLSRPVLTFLAIDLVFTFALGLGEPYLVTYAMDGAGLTTSQWGLTMSLSLLVHCVTMLIVASPSNRNRMKFVLASMLTWPLTYFLFANTHSFPQVLTVRVGVSIAAAVGQPAWEALFPDYCPKEHRGRFFALLEIAWSLLYGGGNFVGGVLYQNQGIRTPFLVATALMAVASVIAVFVLKEPGRREE